MRRRGSISLPHFVHISYVPLSRRVSADLIAAASHVKKARTEFIKAIADVPGDLPCPDETQRMREVSRKLVDARERMMDAQNRLNDYLNCGMVPEDLKRYG